MKTLRSMRTAMMCAVAIAGVAAAAIIARPIPAASGGALLAGTIKSASGGKLAGVTVSAKMEGSTITTSVFTDEQGDYYFPPMAAGKYQVWAQADTFETARGDAELATTRHRDFTLKPLKDYETQLTGDQILASLPQDTPQDRRMMRVFRNNCTSCHQPNYILQNRFDADGWVSIMNAMRYFFVTGNYLDEDSPMQPTIQYFEKDLAAYLAKARGPGQTSMEFKVRPRPAGEPARVVFTEYDVPLDPGLAPELKYPTNNGSDWSMGTPSGLSGSRGVHDAQADLNGNIWFTHSVLSPDITIGRVSMKTGEVKLFRLPGARGMAAGSHGMTRDSQGNLWFNVINPAETPGIGALGRVDAKTEKIDEFFPPKGMAGTGGTLDIDGKGKVWVTTNVGALRFDPDTHEFKEFRSLTWADSDGNGMTYGLAADGQGNGWWAEMGIDIMGHSDIETGKSQEVRIPPVPGQRERFTPKEQQVFSMSGSDFDTAVPWGEGPRRLGADKNGNFVWVCDFWGGNLAKIDIRTQKVTIVPLPRPDAMQPYHATVDKDHNVWVNAMNADEVLRFNPTTSEWTEFPLPTLGAETRYMSLLEQDGSMQVILPYSRTRKVARMTFRSRQEIQALKVQVQQQEQERAQLQ